MGSRKKAKTPVPSEFLNTDLVFCSTFVEIAKQEIDLGEHGFAQQMIDRAEEVYTAIGNYIATLKREPEGDRSERRAVEQQLSDIKDRLDTLRSQLKTLAN